MSPGYLILKALAQFYKSHSHTYRGPMLDPCWQRPQRVSRPTTSRSYFIRPTEHRTGCFIIAAGDRPTDERSDDLTEIEISTRRRRSLNTEGKRGRLRSGLPLPRARDVRPGMLGGESEESRENFTSCGSPVCVMLIVLTRSRCERFTFPCMPASVELVAARGVAGLGSGKQTYKRIGRFCRRLQLVLSQTTILGRNSTLTKSRRLNLVAI